MHKVVQIKVKSEGNEKHTEGEVTALETMGETMRGIPSIFDFELPSSETKKSITTYTISHIA